MRFPKLGEAQLARIIQEVAQYTGQQRQTYQCRAVPLDGHQRSAMQPFFPASSLDLTRIVVLAGERVCNPPFYPELQKMGFKPGSLPDFSLMAAITFVDTVVSHEPLTDRLLFHEIVHVVQYEMLGLQEFTAKYVRGFLTGGSYAAIPLEMNAYELEARFAAAPARPFSVADVVQRWIGADRF